MKWTEKQQQVIDTRNRNLLVSAAAGSGKTAVLVERIIQMVSDAAATKAPIASAYISNAFNTIKYKMQKNRKMHTGRNATIHPPLNSSFFFSISGVSPL